MQLMAKKGFWILDQELANAYNAWENETEILQVQDKLGLQNEPKCFIVPLCVI